MRDAARSSALIFPTFDVNNPATSAAETDHNAGMVKWPPQSRVRAREAWTADVKLGMTWRSRQVIAVAGAPKPSGLNGNAAGGLAL
jgi:hypothetical protein